MNTDATPPFARRRSGGGGVGPAAPHPLGDIWRLGRGFKGSGGGGSGSFKLKVLIVALLLATGCTDSSIIPIAGYWTGGFNAKPADPKVRMRPEWVYKGYLQLYATGMKYKMHMESVAQIVDVSGTWQKKKDKIYLTSNLIEFDDKGGDLQRPVGVKPLPPPDVRQAYGQVMGFNYVADKHELDGLDMSMGPIIGRHVFIKGGE